MNKTRSLALGLLLTAGAPLATSAAIMIDVLPSSAPNFFGSPSWTGYQSNGMNAILNGLSSIGDRDTDPTAYLAFADGSEIDAGNAMVTSFNSWLGQADPPPPFDAELGNRLHFGLHAYGDMQFTLEDVNFEISSTDGGNLLGFTGSLDGRTLNGTSRIGIDWGADGLQGTADDIILDAGQDDTTLMNELIYIGVGNAYWPGGGDPDPANPIAGRQGAIDNTRAFIAANDPVVVSGRYEILTNSATASVTLVASVPEPSSVALLGGAVLAFCFRGRRAIAGGTA